MGKFCANCGNTINDGEMFCTRCGTSTAGTATDQINQDKQKETPTGRKWFFWCFIWIGFMVLVIVAISAAIWGNGPSREKREKALAEESSRQAAVSESIRNEEIKDKILDVLNSTKVDSNFSPTIGNMVIAVIKDYQITYVPVGNSKTLYRVTIKGEYSPNPDLPYLSYSSYIIYTIDIEKSTCELYSDPDNLEGIFLVYIVH